MTEHDDEIGILDGDGVVRRELEVVRFDTGRCQVRDAHPVAANLGDQLGQRREGGDDRQPPVGRCGAVTTAPGHGQSDDDEQSNQAPHKF